MNNFLSKTVNNLGGFIIKKSPTILMSLGVVGCITTTAIAVKETPKAIQLLKDKKEELKTDKLDLKTIVKETWKLYLPAVVIGGVSVACIIFSHSINERRKAALATAYALAETTMLEYRDKVAEEIGRDKELEIRKEITDKHADDYKKIDGSIDHAMFGKVIFKETITGKEFWSTPIEVENKLIDLNTEILDNGYVTLNEYLHEFGLGESAIGRYEWRNKIDYRFESYTNEFNYPALAIEYYSFPGPPIRFGDL